MFCCTFCRPTLDEIKEACLSARGGKCYTLNVFFKYLLDALGYNTHFLLGDTLYMPENHVLVLVNNSKVKGDQFIVDVGMGYPQFVPVSLDFQDESPVYSQSFCVFKFVQRKGGEIIKYHAKNALSLRKKGLDNISEDDWTHKYTLPDLTPKDLSCLDGPMDKVYTESIRSPSYLSFKVIAFCGTNLRAVCFKNSSLLLENEHKCLEELKLKNTEELLEKVQQLLYFPILYEDAKGAIKQHERRLTF